MGELNLKTFSVKTLAGDSIPVTIYPSDCGLLIRKKIAAKWPGVDITRMALISQVGGRNLNDLNDGDEIFVFIQDEFQEKCERVPNFSETYPNKPKIHKLSYISDDIYKKINIFSKIINGSLSWSYNLHTWFQTMENMFERYQKDSLEKITDKQIENMIHIWWVYN